MSRMRNGQALSLEVENEVWQPEIGEESEAWQVIQHRSDL